MRDLNFRAARMASSSDEFKLADECLDGALIGCECRLSPKHLLSLERVHCG
jgi:hypothetical protein